MLQESRINIFIYGAISRLTQAFQFYLKTNGFEITASKLT